MASSDKLHVILESRLKYKDTILAVVQSLGALW